jgi:hypothetical protein
MRFAAIGQDDLVREEAMFFQSAQTDVARRRMAAGLAGGMQTPDLERCCFDHIWGAFADSPATTK